MFRSDIGDSPPWSTSPTFNYAEELLSSRRWGFRRDPFPHFLVQNVFREAVYSQLVAEFQQVLRRGFSESVDPDKFSLVTGYDAYAVGFRSDPTHPFRIFVSRWWHDLIAKVTGVTATGDIRGGLHHHVPGSTNGAIHNDLNPGWFVDAPNEDGINVSNGALCSYHYGTTTNTALKPRESVRAVAVLLYLNNPTWAPGDGGETGLYHGADVPVEKPAVAIPPINNSMLVFECTPFSYHAFLSNLHHPRNSVIMWLHRPAFEAAGLWGDRKIVKWRNGEQSARK
jgi:hypothetical protein